MKIGILTLSIAVNYGGILQAFALQTTLKKMGHDTYLINRRRNRISKTSYLINLFKKKILVAFLNKKPYSVYSEDSMRKREAKLGLHTHKFISKYITPRTPEFYSSKEMRKMTNFDAYIVGSDQIWRPKYTTNIYDYFLDFVYKPEAKRIAYAASFGTNKWEFSDYQTARCRSLLEKFNAVSVRELDAVDICYSKFAVKAQHVLDPTMLLTKEEYIELLSLNKISPHMGNLMTYILDMNPYNQKIINSFSKKNCLKVFDLSFNDKSYNEIQPAGSVEAWLRGFIDAEFIITDSFHGTVFSLLFNKPFLTIANKSRGLSRFQTLLSIFDLEGRIVSSIDEITSIQLSEINWSKTNKILQQKRMNSLKFLKDSLEN